MDWTTFTLAGPLYIPVNYTCRQRMENLKKKRRRAFYHSEILKMKRYYFLMQTTMVILIFSSDREETIILHSAGKCKTVYLKMTVLEILQSTRRLLEIRAV